MPRPIWSGAISFGLITVPVRLFPAVKKKSVSFNQLDSVSGSRIKQKRVSAETGEEVPYDQIVKGYEITKDNYVIVSDDELSSLDPKKSKTIDITEFVKLDEIDPVYFDSAYVVAPDELSAKAYAVLTQAMEAAGMVAIATFVMRTKQYVAAVRATDGHLMLSTMVYGDEVLPLDDFSEFDVLDDVDIKPAELAMAEQLIESLSEEFDPMRHEDSYRQRVMDMVQAKADGEELVAVADEEEDAQIIDLAAALEASVKAAKAARKRHPSGNAEADEDNEPAAKKPAAKKRATKKKATKKAPAKKAAAKAKKSA